MALKTHWVYIAEKKKNKKNPKQTGSVPQRPSHTGRLQGQTLALLSGSWRHGGPRGAPGSPTTGTRFVGTPLETANEPA